MVTPTVDRANSSPRAHLVALILHHLCIYLTLPGGPEPCWEHELISSSHPPLEVLAFQSLSCRVARTQAATCSMSEGRGGPPELHPGPAMLSWPLAGVPAGVFLLLSWQRLMGKSRGKCHRGIRPALALTDASLPGGCVSPGE